MVPTPKPISTCGRPVSWTCIKRFIGRAQAPGIQQFVPQPKQNKHKQRIGNIAGVEEALRYFPLNSDFDEVKSAIKPRKSSSFFWCDTSGLWQV